MSTQQIAYVVYGAKGCGKTRNRDAIARHLTGDPTAFVDDYGWGRHHRLSPGKVHLTYETPNLKSPRWAARSPGTIVRFIRFSDIMCEIRAKVS